ncbi:hypothetical protein ACSBR1_023926 [Camellia fascicularis]
MLILMETKVEFNSMGMFFNRMGFTASSHVDPIGRSGGIWLVWNPILVNVRVTEASSQLITATISRQDYPDWILSAIYASPISQKRDELWNNLERTSQTITDPWLLAGDFNDFASLDEKRTMSGSQNQSQDQRRAQKFTERVNNCNLMDLGCIGPKVTWSNNKKGWANTMVRLDRAMCNTEWRTSFPDDAWISYEEFQSVVDSNWKSPSSSVLDKLDNLTSKITVWNKESKIFVSPNVDRHKAKELSDRCGIPLTSDLGKYLGVPLIHGRVSWRHYNGILNKMQMKLAGWKTSVLSLVGRTTLIQSVSSALPAYTMQTVAFPKRVCNDIDKMNRNFLWGDTLEKKKIHLVKWDVKMISHGDGLWKEVLKCKYMRNNCLQACFRDKKASHTWRGILNSRAILRKGVKWTVGNGATINCWKDWWSGDKAFEDLTLSSSQSAPFWESDVTVNNLLSEQGSWNETVICEMLPPTLASIILNRPSPTSLEPDEPNWKGSADGIFSSASVYVLVSGNQPQGEDWQWLWKLRIPQKLKGFLWCCIHGKLLTNKHHLKKGLSLEATCPNCYKEEDRNHPQKKCGLLFLEGIGI